MNPQFQLSVQRYGWDRAANLYDISWQRQLKPAQEKLLEMADLQREQRVLDIACGTGLISIPATEKIGFRGQLTGIDISGKMVDIASLICKKKGIENACFQRAAAETLPFGSNCFDRALSGLGMMYYSNPLKATREMYRVLKSEGKAVAAVWGTRENCGWASIFDIMNSRVKSDVYPFFFQLGTDENLKLLFEKTGFKNVKSYRISSTLRYSSAEIACLAVFAGGPVAMAYSHFDERTKAGTHLEYLGAISPFRRGKGYAIPGEFVIVVGEKGR